MKKYLLCLCLMPDLAHAQDVFKFRAYETKITYDSATLVSVASDTAWSTQDILVVISPKDERISLYSKTTIRLDVVSVTNAPPDSSGNSWIFYRCVDNRGTDCTASLVIYKDQTVKHSATFFVNEPGFTVAYRLKRTPD